MDLSEPADVRPDRAVSGPTERTLQGLDASFATPYDYLRRSFVPALPRGTPPQDQP